MHPPQLCYGLSTSLSKSKVSSPAAQLRLRYIFLVKYGNYVKVDY
jgi:hypothetical protein